MDYERPDRACIQHTYGPSFNGRQRYPWGPHKDSVSHPHATARLSPSFALSMCMSLQLCIVPWSDIIAANNWGIIGTLGTTEFGILPSHPDHSTHIAYMTSSYLDSSMCLVYDTWSRINASAVGWLLYFRRLFPSWIISLSVAPLSG